MKKVIISMLCIIISFIVFTIFIIDYRQNASVGIPLDSLSQQSQLLNSNIHINHEGKLNINTAITEELSLLPGIGESLAKHIVEYRIEHGHFQSINEILKVKGIGEAKFSQIKDHICVE